MEEEQIKLFKEMLDELKLMRKDMDYQLRRVATRIEEMNK